MLSHMTLTYDVFWFVLVRVVGPVALSLCRFRPFVFVRSVVCPVSLFPRGTR